MWPAATLYFGAINVSVSATGKCLLVVAGAVVEIIEEVLEVADGRLIDSPVLLRMSLIQFVADPVKCGECVDLRLKPNFFLPYSAFVIW